MMPGKVLESSKKIINAKLLEVDNKRHDSVRKGDLDTALWLEHFGAGLRAALGIIEKEEKR